MQRVGTPDVSPAEWRWVIIFSGILVAITLLPFGFAFARNATSDSWRFMGMLANPLDGATYLSKIGQGLRGDWLFTLSYTAEPHTGIAINEFYIALGHVARVLGMSPLLVYHIARLITGFFMYLSIYHLGSTIWKRLRPRRLFFSLIAVGSGAGWLAILLIRGASTVDASQLPTDLVIPESIPLYATFVNPHFPLAIALIALLAATFVLVFRPGFDMSPTLANGGATVVVLTILLCIVQPQGYVPLATALGVYIAITIARTRKVPWLELRWVSLVILPAIPILAYYLIAVNSNAVMQGWNIQNSTPSPSLDKYIFGFGLLLVVAIPGLWRGLRYFERDGDRFMLIWFVVNVILLYAPLSLQRRLAIGLIIPIVYFGVRALEDYWFYLFERRRPKRGSTGPLTPPDYTEITSEELAEKRIHRPRYTVWRDAALVALFVFILPSNILALGIPLFGVVKPESGLQANQILPTNYADAVFWLRDSAQGGQVVLAPPAPSLWIPAYSSQRVVYGHPFETLNARQKLEEVNAWYHLVLPGKPESADAKAQDRYNKLMGWYNGQNCNEILDLYRVHYVVIGPKELGPDIPQTACARTFTRPVATFGDVAVYDVLTAH